jgi:hypothetical protein
VWFEFSEKVGENRRGCLIGIKSYFGKVVSKILTTDTNPVNSTVLFDGMVGTNSFTKPLDVGLFLKTQPNNSGSVRIAGDPSITKENAEPICLLGRVDRTEVVDVNVVLRFYASFTQSEASFPLHRIPPAEPLTDSGKRWRQANFAVFGLAGRVAQLVGGFTNRVNSVLTGIAHQLRQEAPWS